MKKESFNKEQFLNLIELAEHGTEYIFKIQRRALDLE